jgi:hypothetical protein
MILPRQSIASAFPGDYCAAIFAPFKAGVIVMYKLTGKSYRPNVSHNIASWNAIARCMYVNGGKATRQQLEAAIPQNHPLPVKGDYSGNVVKHIDWHIENGRLVKV